MRKKGKKVKTYRTSFMSNFLGAHLEEFRDKTCLIVAWNHNLEAINHLSEKSISQKDFIYIKSLVYATLAGIRAGLLDDPGKQVQRIAKLWEGFPSYLSDEDIELTKGICFNYMELQKEEYFAVKYDNEFARQFPELRELADYKNIEFLDPARRTLNGSN